MIDVKLKTSPPPTVDENDRKTKAKSLHLLSFSKPHGRTFHVAWFSFMIAFTGWYAIAPLKPYIKSDLKLTSEIATSDIFSGLATIIFRVVAGVSCDLVGPKRVITALLFAGAIPTALAGLINNADGLYAIRFFIGVLGATFVPCQFYTTQMYEKNVVGSANAFAGGWGNLGGGLTYILMPLVFDGINSSVGNTNASWRIAMIIPAGLCIIAGLLNIFFADDYPGGDWLKRSKTLENGNAGVVEIHEANEKKLDGYNVEHSEQDKPKKTGKLTELLSAFCNPNFGLKATNGNFIGAVFGLMNFFSRATGGILSDYANKKIGMRGRLLTQFLILLFEGIFLIIFGFNAETMTSAIVIMIFFSFFTQGGCGSSYGIAPYIDPPIYGTVAGLIGTGGTIGGIVFNSVFARYSTAIPQGFVITGIVVTCVSFTTFLLKVTDQ
ncbi:21381_t:CDS:2, partial [Dentiscutata erythropus]